MRFKFIGKGRKEADVGVFIKVWRDDGVGGRVVESYRVGLSTVKIIESGASYRYVVVDPPVSESALKKLAGALERLVEEVDPSLFLNPQKRREATSLLRQRLAKLGVRDEALVYIAERELLGYGPLDPVLRDKKLENVECKGPGQLLNVVHVDYGRIDSNLVFSEEELDRLVSRLVFLAGKSIDYVNPKVDNALLPGVGRLTATYGKIISSGSSFVVRIFPEKPWTVLGFLERNTFSPELAAYLWLALEYKMPILVAGEMGSGKTSFANALLGLAPPDKRIGTAEDVPEFKIPHPNWQPYVTEEKRGITLFDLVKLLLRANVDYMVINEIRGAEESKAWFQAISTGHGGVTTIHADTVESVFNRLDNLGIPPEFLTSLAIVVFIGRFKIGGKVQRRTQYVFDIIDPSARRYSTIFAYDAFTDTYKVGDLASARTTKRILELAKWDYGKFVEEYEKRAEFLRRLYCVHLQSPIDSNGLTEYLARFYRGFMPQAPSRCEPRRVKERRKDVPKPDWVVKLHMPPGVKKVRLKGEGLELIDPHVDEIETSDSVLAVSLKGSGVLVYEVEQGGRVVAKGVVPLAREHLPSSPTARAGRQISRQPQAMSAGNETQVVDVETKIVEKSQGMCLKFSEGVVPLVPGREYGRGDFGFLGETAATISRRHFRVEEKGGILYIVDIGSTNGTFIDGVRLNKESPAAVRLGAKVKLGLVEGEVGPC